MVAWKSGSCAVRDEPRRPVRVAAATRLSGAQAYRLGTAVGQQVVAPGHVLVPGPRQVAGGGEHRGPVGEHRPGQRVAFRARDERAADPGHAALVRHRSATRRNTPLAAAAACALTTSAGRFSSASCSRPVHRAAIKVGASRAASRSTGELQVVADHHGTRPSRCPGRSAASPGVKTSFSSPTGAPCGKRPGADASTKAAAVVQAAVGAGLAEAADDDQTGAGRPSSCHCRRVALSCGGRGSRGPRQPGRRRRRRCRSRTASGRTTSRAPAAPPRRPRPRSPPVGVRLGHGDREAGRCYQGGVHCACSVRRDRTIDSILHWEQ